MSPRDDEESSPKKPAARKPAAAKPTGTKPSARLPAGDTRRTKKGAASKAAAKKDAAEKDAAKRPSAEKRPRKKIRRRAPIPVIGWREWVAVPDLGIARIKAKADTGARTSALHAVGVRVRGKQVRFRVHPVQRETGLTVQCSAPLLGYRSVRSSTGEVTRRPVILTRLVIGERAWEIEVTLVRRELMGFRMLLGRQAVRLRLRVDPGRSFLTDHPRLPALEERRKKKPALRATAATKKKATKEKPAARKKPAVKRKTTARKTGETAPARRPKR